MIFTKKLLFFSAIILIVGQGAIAMSGGPSVGGGVCGDEPSFNFFAECFHSPPAVKAIAHDNDQLVNLVATKMPEIFFAMPVEHMREDELDSIFDILGDLSQLLSSITKRLEELPAEMHADSVVQVFVRVYSATLCPHILKKILLMPMPAARSCVRLAIVLHYVACCYWYAVDQKARLSNQLNEYPMITLAAGLARFMRADGELKTTEKFKAELEALDLKEYFEHWYGNAAFVEHENGGGQGAAVGEEDVEDGEEEERGEDAE